MYAKGVGVEQNVEIAIGLLRWSEMDERLVERITFGDFGFLAALVTVGSLMELVLYHWFRWRK
jgi:hypothetical protein